MSATLSKRQARALKRQQAAIEAAFIEGYVQGSAHPRGASVIEKAKTLAHLWWRTIELRLYDRLGEPTPDGVR